MSDLTKLESDAASVAVAGLQAIKTANDSFFATSETAVPTVTGDVATFAEDYIENHIGGLGGSFLKSALGLAGGAITAAEAGANTALGAALHIADVRIDADLAGISAKLSLGAQ